MASISALSSKLDTLLKRLHSTFTGKLDVDAQAADSALLEGKTAAEVRADVISNELATINGRPGEVAVFEQEGVAMSFKAMQLFKTVRIAATTAEADSLKAATISFADVFDKWKRISHGTTETSPSIPAELDGWSYNSSTDKVSSTLNSNSLIGLISNDRFDTYNFEVIMSSNVADDDAIGIMLAYKKVGAVEHTLMLVVDGGGLPSGQAKARLVYNNPRPSMNVIFSTNLGIVNQTWDVGVDLSLGVRVVAKRKIDKTFEIEVTKADGSPWPTPVYWTGAIPDIFLSPCAIGYVAMSQEGATWENVSVPMVKSEIIDNSNGVVWRWQNNAWANAGTMDNESALQRGLIYKDSVSNTAYFLDIDGEFHTLGASGVP